MHADRSRSLHEHGLQAGRARKDRAPTLTRRNALLAVIEQPSSAISPWPMSDVTSAARGQSSLSTPHPTQAKVHTCIPFDELAFPQT